MSPHRESTMIERFYAFDAVLKTITQLWAGEYLDLDCEHENADGTIWTDIAILHFRDLEPFHRYVLSDKRFKLEYDMWDDTFQCHLFILTWLDTACHFID